MIPIHSRIGVCLGAAALLLSACSQPAVSPKSPSFQKSENTVRDWDGVAHEITAQMAATGLLPAPAAPQQAPAQPPPRPIFVRVEAPDSAFLREVGSEIEADVLRRGGAVSRTMLNATVVNLGVSFVQWSPRDNPLGLLAAGEVLVDALAAVPRSNAEAVWEATVVSADSVLMRMRDRVYIRNGDIGLYARSIDLAPASSWGESQKLPAVPVRYQP